MHENETVGATHFFVLRLVLTPSQKSTRKWPILVLLAFSKKKISLSFWSLTPQPGLHPSLAARLTRHETNLQSTDNGLTLVFIFNYVPVNDGFVSVLHRGTATSQPCCYGHVTAILAFHGITVWIQEAQVFKSEVWYYSFVNVHSHLVLFTLNRDSFAKFRLKMTKMLVS